MSTIKVGENETLDSALRRFKRRCARDGIIGDLRIRGISVTSKGTKAQNQRK